jgi:flagellar hook assembly protein FlgD
MEPDQSTYLYGDTVYVTAVPDSGWTFESWSDGLTGSENPDTVVMVSDTTVTGTFHEIPTAVESTPVVKVLTLRQNVPNPFNQGTYFDYGLPKSADVTFDIFDIAGRRVFTKHLPRVRAGWNRFEFDGNDLNGRPLPSGVYFYRLKTPQGVQTKKMVIIK